MDSHLEAWIYGMETNKYGDFKECFVCVLYILFRIIPNPLERPSSVLDCVPSLLPRLALLLSVTPGPSLGNEFEIRKSPENESEQWNTDTMCS